MFREGWQIEVDGVLVPVPAAAAPDAQALKRPAAVPEIVQGEGVLQRGVPETGEIIIQGSSNAWGGTNVPFPTCSSCACC